ncbi:MAG: hypothetical protein ACHREM_10935 [Polyangiales bacterium]
MWHPRAVSAFPKSDAFVTEIQREFPHFRIVEKRGRALQHAIDRFLKAVTLGGQHEYLTRYHTVLGDTLYVPDAWPRGTDDARYVLLRHERIHLRQRRRYGMVGMALIYLLPIFPIGLAYGRARIEWEAYEETLRATAEIFGIEAAKDKSLHDYLIAQFTGAAYGWMWPFPSSIRCWIDAAIAKIVNDDGGA